MRDINFLQGCLDDEATFRAESVGTLTREPTLTGLGFIEIKCQHFINLLEFVTEVLKIRLMI